MAYHLEYHGDGTYYERAQRDADHVAWPVDQLPRLAADIHRTVLALVVRGASPDDVDTTIIDLLCGAPADAARMPAAE